MKTPDAGITTAPLLTAHQVARLTNLAPQTIYMWADQGRLPCYRMGRSVRFRMADVQSFIDSSRREAQA